MIPSPRFRIASLLVASLLPLAACQTTPHAATGPALSDKAATTQPVAALAPADLQDLLSQLAKAHKDKIQLSGYVAMPFLHKVDPAVRQFTDDMGKQHKILLADLEAFAKAHHISLKYEYPTDVPGQALKAMENSQGDALQAAKGQYFELMVLMLMYTDYDWQRNLIQTLRPLAKDPALKNYLDRSLAVHQTHLAQIQMLLKKFQMPS